MKKLNIIKTAIIVPTIIGGATLPLVGCSCHYDEKPEVSNVSVKGNNIVPCNKQETYSAEVIFSKEDKQLDHSVTWSIEDPDFTGSIISEQGCLTAGEIGGTVKIIATSNFDPSKSATKLIKIDDTGGKIIIDNNIEYIVVGETHQFKAHSEQNEDFGWEMIDDRGTGSTITESGLLTAGSQPGSVTIGVWSKTNPSLYERFSVDVTVVKSVKINAPYSVNNGVEIKFKPVVEVVGSYDPRYDLKWENVPDGTIYKQLEDGWYSIIPGEKTGVITLTMTSEFDSKRSATAEIYVNPFTFSNGEVTGFTKEEYRESMKIIQIPEQYMDENGKVDYVTGIGKSAFAGTEEKRVKYNSFIFGKWITTIGERAFAYTDLPASFASTNFKIISSIGDYAFEGATLDYYVSIPKYVEHIGKYAFASTNIMQIDLTAFQLQRIPEYAFAMMPLLSSIWFRDALQTIGVGAFEGCISLAHVKFPSQLQTIENYAFLDCISLKSLDFTSFMPISYYVPTMGAYCFSGLYFAGVVQVKAALRSFELQWMESLAYAGMNLNSWAISWLN